MSLPYPMDNRNMVQMPDPDNPVPLSAYNNQPYGNNQMYPQLPQQELPYPQHGTVHLPPDPSQNPGAYMPGNMTPYPPQNYAPPPDNSMPTGYPPQNPMCYQPQNQMPYPPQGPNSYQPSQGNMPAYPQQGYPSQPSAPLPPGSFDESLGGIDLNEGLLSRGGEMMNLGK